jgi:hypothetical protein
MDLVNAAVFNAVSSAGKPVRDSLAGDLTKISQMYGY